MKSDPEIDRINQERIREVTGDYIAARQAIRRAADLIERCIDDGPKGARAYCHGYMQEPFLLLEMDAFDQLRNDLNRVGEMIASDLAVRRELRERDKSEP